MHIESIVNSVYDKAVAHRRWLHAHPELSGEEKESAAYIAAELRKLGLEPKENVGGYGVTAVIEGKPGEKCVGLRADFDALSIQEETGLPFASQNPGVCHACGHDVHAGMLLGAAEVLLQLRDQFTGKVKLIFQPSEENAADSGSKRMIADGALEDPKVDVIFGQHVSTSYPTGTIAFKSGAMSASSDRFFITIKGKSAHGSAPSDGVDAVVIGAQVICALQSIVSRSVSPKECVVLTIGKVAGGDRYNIIPDSFSMEGTCRTVNAKVQAQIPGRMEAIIKGITEGMGGSYEFTYINGFIPTVNDPALFETVLATAQKELGQEQVKIQEKSSMGGEDFAFFAKEVPGNFFMLGCREPGADYVPAHNGKFSPHEEAMRYGIKLMVLNALTYLAED